MPSEELPVGGGRVLHVPRSLKGVGGLLVQAAVRRSARCGGLSRHCPALPHLIVVGLPVLGPEMRNEAARFVTLIDSLYEHKVKLIAGADAEPADLYPQGDGSFEFQRTVSRLMEMQSAEYLALATAPTRIEPSGSAPRVT